jgi:hypothetical protein
MKKVLFTLLVIVSFMGVSQAQNMSVGAGVVVSLPMGDFGESANTGFGGMGAFELGFTPQLVGIGNIGYITWGTEAEGFSYSVVPVLFGVKYFFMPAGGLYGTGKIGLSFFSVETPTINVGGFTFGGGSASSSEFTFVVGAGYVVPVSPNIDLDFGAAFNVVSDLNHITASVTANFGL